MTSCDLCGREIEDYYEVVIEGSMLKVCISCSKFGNVVNVRKIEKEEKKEKFKLSEQLRKNVKELSIESIVNDYNLRIKKAREEKGLKQEELAKSIGVKESVIHSIESRKIEPSIDIAKRLENFLNIVLIEKISNINEERKIDFKNTELTIGDLLKFKQK